MAKKNPAAVAGCGVFGIFCFGQSLSEYPASSYENKNNEAKEYDDAVERRHGTARVECDRAGLVPVVVSVLHCRC